MYNVPWPIFLSLMYWQHLLSYNLPPRTWVQGTTSCNYFIHLLRNKFETHASQAPHTGGEVLSIWSTYGNQLLSPQYHILHIDIQDFSWKNNHAIKILKKNISAGKPSSAGLVGTTFSPQPPLPYMPHHTVTNLFHSFGTRPLYGKEGPL